MFGGLVAVGVLVLAAGMVWSAREGKRARPIDNQPDRSYEPTGQAIRLEQLKTIAALRDSGALTEAEFETEKRRILNS